MTSEYALRALIFIARDFKDESVLARQIAESTGIPGNYLSKILRELVRVGVLDSTRGIGGGFRLLRPTGELRLAEIVAPFESTLQNDRCPFGSGTCSDESPCNAHEHWRPLRAAVHQFLENTTLEQIAAGDPSRGAAQPRSD